MGRFENKKVIRNRMCILYSQGFHGMAGMPGRPGPKGDDVRIAFGYYLSLCMVLY